MSSGKTTGRMVSDLHPALIQFMPLLCELFKPVISFYESIEEMMVSFGESRKSLFAYVFLNKQWC